MFWLFLIYLWGCLIYYIIALVSLFYFPESKFTKKFIETDYVGEEMVLWPLVLPIVFACIIAGMPVKIAKYVEKKGKERFRHKKEIDINHIN